MIFSPVYFFSGHTLFTWILSERALSWSAGNSTGGVHWEIRGIIVTPAWPPITGQSTSAGSKPWKNRAHLKKFIIGQCLAFGIYRVCHGYLDNFGLNFEILKTTYLFKKIRPVLRTLRKNLSEDDTLKLRKVKVLSISNLDSKKNLKRQKKIWNNKVFVLWFWILGRIEICKR